MNLFRTWMRARGTQGARGRDGPWPTTGAWLIGIALASVFLIALLVRALGYEWVFIGDEVLLLVGDGQLHARRALYNFVNFPALLLHDPYMNYPDGAVIPDPPLLDFLLAAFTRAFGGDRMDLEVLLAWWSPVCGVLTLIPVYLVARIVAGRGVALGAIAIFSVLPIVVTASQVGNADHHAALELLGASLLALCMAIVRPGSGGRSLVLAGLGFAIVRIVLPLSWKGSLLYTGLADGLIVLIGTLAGRREVLALATASLIPTAAVLLIAVRLLPEPPGGPYSATALSLLQMIAALAAGVVAAGAWAIEHRRPQRRTSQRLLHLVGITAVVAATLLLFPGIRGGLSEGLHFVGTAESGSFVTQELLPLFPIFGRPTGQPPVLYFGYLAYLLPVAPFAALFAARDPRLREPALLLAGWAAALAAMTLWQVRHGADFAPAGCVVFAMLLAAISEALRSRLRLPRAVVVATMVTISLGLLWTPIRILYIPKAISSLAALRAGPSSQDRALANPSGSLTRFLQSVRKLTPETSGYLDASQVPEYGILCSMNLGSAVHYVARRASPANGFQDLLDPEIFFESQRFFAVRDESEAISIAARLRARYVVTMFYPGLRPGSVGERLQVRDGRGSATEAPLERFRLVTEGPAGGVPLSDLFGFRRPARVVPYKLFEIVPGALIEAQASPGTRIVARMRLRTPLGRRFVYEARGVSGDDGVARVRIPYPTGGAAPVRAVGPLAVVVGEKRQRVQLSEADVRGGATVRIEGES